MDMTIKLSQEFINKLALPNYIISGFRYRFSQDIAIDTTWYKDPVGDPQIPHHPDDSDASYMINHHDGTGINVDHVNLNMIRIVSSPFECATILDDNKLSLSVTTKYDTDNKYNWLLIYYYDMMTSDFSEVHTDLDDNVESGLRLAAIADYKSLRRHQLVEGKKEGLDIPNIIELKGLTINCSILTRYFNPEEITHIIRTDLTSSDYTDESVAVSKTLLKLEPTKNYLHDNMISMDRAVDSFMIGSSGIIDICNESCIQQPN